MRGSKLIFLEDRFFPNIFPYLRITGNSGMKINRKTSQKEKNQSLLIMILRFHLVIHSLIGAVKDEVSAISKAHLNVQFRHVIKRPFQTQAVIISV